MDRLQELRNYADQMRQFGMSVTREDFEAAGFTDDEIEKSRMFEALKYAPAPANAEPFEEANFTMREEDRSSLEQNLQKLGFSAGSASRTARGLLGDPNRADGIGLLDLTPVGTAYSTQEGSITAKRGYETGSTAEMALGALDVGLGAAEALPLAGAAVKGSRKVLGNIARRAVYGSGTEVAEDAATDVVQDVVQDVVPSVNTIGDTTPAPTQQMDEAFGTDVIPEADDPLLDLEFTPDDWDTDFVSLDGDTLVDYAEQPVDLEGADALTQQMRSLFQPQDIPKAKTSLESQRYLRASQDAAESLKPMFGDNATAVAERFNTKLGDIVDTDLQNTNLGYAPNLRLHDLAKIANGDTSIFAALDHIGTDATLDAVNYVSDAIKKLDLQNDTQFQQYATYIKQNPDYDPYVNTVGRIDRYSSIMFRSPVVEIAARIPIPSKGLKGADFLKELRKNPTVRNSELDSLELQIDPQKRYTSDELQDIASQSTYEVRANLENKWERYQGQDDLLYPKEDYFELTIDASKPGGATTFIPNYTHYTDNTLAHTRATIRSDADGQFILPEEYQSDLLQKGYKKPKTVDPQEQADAYAEILKGIDNAANNQTTMDWDDALGELVDVPVPRDETTFGLIHDTLSTVSAQDLETITGNYDRAIDVKGALLDAFPELRKADQYQLSHVAQDIIDTMPRRVVAVPPPIKTTEDGVRLAFDALLAEGQKRGVTRIVLPPFDKILEKRASDIAYNYSQKLKRQVSVEEALELAKQPTSGFYDTYVRATDRVLEQYQKDFGADKFVIKETTLPFEAEIEYTPAEVADVLDAMDPNDARMYLPNGPAMALEDIPIAIDTIRNRRTTPTQIVDELGQDGFLKAVRTENLPTREIDFSGVASDGYDLTRPRFAEGGVVKDSMETQMNKLRQEGGIANDGATVDPVSGNEVPPGSLAKEVRDDIPANLSEGEYVVPADVLRYYGVSFFEKLREKAKAGLQKMDADGRIGGDTGPSANMESEDDLPFDVSELAVSDDSMDGQMASMGLYRGGAVKMAEGGVTPTFNPQDWATVGSSYAKPVQQEYRVLMNDAGQMVSILYINGQPQQAIPAGYKEQTPEAAQQAVQETAADAGVAAAEREANAADDADRASMRPDSFEGWDNLGIDGLISETGKLTSAEHKTAMGLATAVPGIGVLAGVADYAQRVNALDAVTKALQDPALTDKQRADLESRQEDLSKLGGGALGKVAGAVKDFFTGDKPTSTATRGGDSGGSSLAPTKSSPPRSRPDGLTRDSASTSSGGSTSSGASYGGGSSNDPDDPSNSTGAGRARGGLMAKKKPTTTRKSKKTTK
jgi:hypothetical protein